MQFVLTERRLAESRGRGVDSRVHSALSPARVVIENVAPEIDSGRFPIKRTIGEVVEVAADIHADGHEVLAAVLHWRFVGNGEFGHEWNAACEANDAIDWNEAPMADLGNDRWIGRFMVTDLGRYEYMIEAWIDEFAGWRRDLAKKIDAAQDVTCELVEGAHLVRETARRIAATSQGKNQAEEESRADSAVALDRHDVEWLLQQATLISAASANGPPQADSAVDHNVPGERRRGSRPELSEAALEGRVDSRIAAALGDELAATMRRHADRSCSAVYEHRLSVTVERERARVGAWYEMFPRSAGDVPGRHGTFRDVERRLPEIAALGFDVLYLPPIHPIGRSFRTGPNNTLTAGANDPGSPWAIGAGEGGHTAVHPELGTIEDFDRLVREARRHDIEIACDIAFQCSPDHPYVCEHPEWFRHRPDGTIKYAENPPKKYQDIYPLDFECDDWQRLWQELKSVVLFWVEHGVTIFRVDNPHTKPFRFWEWLIREVQAEHPEAIFLAEAFTRPKVMRHLAKAGFSQSYTYFTWRNTKQQLTEYLTELTGTDVCEYMRPNLFANTPDILHEYLQYGGRPAFQVRLVLAATLGASYGIYGPAFELCECRAVRHGSEEYLDSEKYQIRHWDRDRPGNIREFIGRVNRIRRTNPALQFNKNLRFYPVDNEQLIFYGKVAPARGTAQVNAAAGASTTNESTNVVLVVVNLDPHHVHSGWVRVPLVELDIGPNDSYQVHDLISDARYLWQGDTNFVRLDPAVCPVHIFRVRRRIKTERDFDYFM
jgi:starch synthase (maltosyl-transferring)